MRPLFTPLLGAALFAACQDQSALVLLQATASTETGAPVANALCAINGEPIGQTDQFGLFQGTLRLTRSKRYEFVISKTSPTTEFSRHRQRLTVPDAPTFKAVVHAVIYAVPKPSSSTRSIVTLEEPVPAAARSSQLTSAAIVAPPLALASPQPTALPQGELPTEVAPPDAPMTPVSDAASPHDEQAFAVINFHVYDHAAPIEGATIFVGDDASRRLINVCSTAANGRCFGSMARRKISRKSAGVKRKRVRK